MINLCIITTIPTTIKVFFGEQLKFLHDHGYDITVITSSSLSTQDYGLPMPENIKLYTVKMSRTIAPVRDFIAFLKILKILRKGKYDIVQYATPKAALLGSTASFCAGVPVRLYLMWGLYYVTQKGFRKFIFKTIEKIICYCSTAIAPDSKGNVRFAIEDGLCKPDKIGVVGHGSANGVDTEKYDPDKLSEDRKRIRAELNISQSAKVFGCIAAIVGDKGINELIEAFQIVSQKYQDVFLLYIGQPTEKDPVKDSTLEMLNHHLRIIRLGWQAQPEKYLAAMDVFILPTYREGFGVVNIEASAMRLPVISTDVPGPRESIVNGETGILVPSKKVEPLAEAMDFLITNPLYAKKLGESGRKRVQELYERKTLWQSILKHREHLLNSSKRKKFS